MISSVTNICARGHLCACASRILPRAQCKHAMRKRPDAYVQYYSTANLWQTKKTAASCTHDALISIQNLRDTINCSSFLFLTCTPSSSLKSSPHSGHCGVASFFMTSSAQDLQSLWPQAACTGSLRSSLQLTQWNWSIATSPLKTFFGNFIPGILSRSWFHLHAAKCLSISNLATTLIQNPVRLSG